LQGSSYTQQEGTILNVSIVYFRNKSSSIKTNKTTKLKKIIFVFLKKTKQKNTTKGQIIAKTHNDILLH